jgi:PPM family protein phosphatase
MSEPAPSSLRFAWAGLTDRGQRRDNNEDAWAAFAIEGKLTALPPEVREWPEHGILLVVSDGMGGASAGEVASELCVQLLPAEVHARRKLPNKADALRDAFLRTHEAIIAAGTADPEKEGMGATLSALWLQPDGSALIGHVGDSRILHRPKSSWLQVTHDHSLGAGMVRRGEITEEMASRLKFRALLEQAMGAGVLEIHPQIEFVAAQPGDTWLLCTDGLYGPLGDQFGPECDKALWRATLRESVHALVDAANAAGGPDNITVVLARCLR